jgi:hypothetical protein
MYIDIGRIFFKSRLTPIKNDITVFTLNRINAISMSSKLHPQAIIPDASRHWVAVPASMDFAGNNAMEMRRAGLPSYCPVCRHGKSTIEKGGVPGTT